LHHQFHHNLLPILWLEKQYHTHYAKLPKYPSQPNFFTERRFRHNDPSLSLPQNQTPPATTEPHWQISSISPSFLESTIRGPKHWPLMSSFKQMDLSEEPTAPGPMGLAKSLSPLNCFTENSLSAVQWSRMVFMAPASNMHELAESFFRPVQFLANLATPWLVSSRRPCNLRHVRLRTRSRSTPKRRCLGCSISGCIGGRDSSPSQSE
jgi:hypothetical protein